MNGGTLNHLCTVGRCPGQHFKDLGCLLDETHPLSFVKTYLLMYLEMDHVVDQGVVSKELAAKYRTMIKSATTIADVDAVARQYLTAAFYNPNTCK